MACVVCDGEFGAAGLLGSVGLWGCWGLLGHWGGQWPRRVLLSSWLCALIDHLIPH